MATAMVGLPSGLGLSPSPRRLVCRGRQWAGLCRHTRENALMPDEAWLMISVGPAAEAAMVRGKAPGNHEAGYIRIGEEREQPLLSDPNALFTQGGATCCAFFSASSGASFWQP
jgi:hypothetical protein